MKKLAFALPCFLVSVAAFAEKVTEVDLRKSTQIVDVDIGKNRHYVIDPIACICTIQYMNGQVAIATIDCRSLRAYPELVKHVEKCSVMSKF